MKTTTSNYKKLEDDVDNGYKDEVSDNDDDGGDDDVSVLDDNEMMTMIKINNHFTVLDDDDNEMMTMIKINNQYKN